MCTVFELKACSLDDVINVKDDVYSNGLPFESAIRIIYQLSMAVYTLEHKCHMIHTDIKPENILISGISNDLKRLIYKFRINNLGKKIKKRIAKKKITEYIVEKIIEDVYNKNDTEYDGPVIDKKYIKKCNVVLGDFGTTIYLEENDGSEIQTRHYRAPEVILGCEYDAKCDVWSIGCTFYEILIGDVLFNPNKSKGLNTDRQHIYDIQKLLGKVPDDMLDKSKKKYVFFRKNGLMKRRTNIEFTPIKSFLKDKLKHKLSSSQLNLVIDFLVKVLVWNPSKRMSVKECCDHPIFQLFKKKSTRNVHIRTP
jgi:serine/threonine protein kinase